MQTFDIYFAGKLLPDADPHRARAAVGDMFKVQGEALDRLFAGKPVRIKKSVDVETANRFRGAFRKAGALVDIVLSGQLPSSDPASAASSSTTEERQSTLSLLPPRTGSLQDCAEDVVGPPIPDTDWMQLDQPGALIDKTPPTPPLQFDTDQWELLAANYGSLEDCHVERPRHPIGDIDWMELDRPGSVIDETPPPPTPDIDTSELDLGPANSGSLADCLPARPARPLPDISHLTLSGTDTGKSR